MRLDDFFPYRLAVTAELFSRQLTAVYGQGHGFSREEWRLLFLLSDGKALDSLQVAQRSSLDKVQVSRAAGKLEAKGLITRDIHDGDRRLRRYCITPRGRQAFDAAFGRVEARAEAILGTMAPADRAALQQGLQALNAATRASLSRPEGSPAQAED